MKKKKNDYNFDNKQREEEPSNLKNRFLVMKKFIGTRILFSFLLLSLMAFTSSTSSLENSNFQNTVEPCFMENKVFQDGEEITYKLYYNWNFVWLAAGEVTFKVNEMGEQFHLSAIGRTYSGYEWFFKVRDYYDTFIEKNSLLPKTSIRNVHEGKYRLYDKMTFDQQNKKIKSLRGKTQEEARPREYEVDDCMHDILSIIYYCRNIDFKSFELGQEVPVKIFMDKEVWPLNVKYKGKSANKKIKGNGKFDTIKFSPQIISGRVFKEGEEMSVYVSDDKNQIPVLIESPVSVGSVKAVLKKHKGLKYNLDAKK